MKNFFLTLCLLVTFVINMSCGNSVVAGKRFQTDNGLLCIDFDKKTDRVYYVYNLGTYSVKGNIVTINFEGKDIQFIKEKNYIRLYNEKKAEANDILFNLKGPSEAFRNILAGETKEFNGFEITFTDNTASYGGKSVGYVFDPETCQYKLDGVISTFIPGQLVRDAYNNLFQQIIGREEKLIDYESAWWLHQKVNGRKATDVKLVTYVGSVYRNEFKEAYSDEFAMQNLLKSKKPEFLEKFNLTNTKEKFIFYETAEIGKYSFDNQGFFIKTKLVFDDIYSTLDGDPKPLDIRLCKLGAYDRFSQSYYIKWLSDVNTSIYLKMDQGKAEQYNKEIGENRNCIILYTVKPVMLIDKYSYTDYETDDKYIMYYEVTGAQILNPKTLEVIGDAYVKYEWNF